MTAARVWLWGSPVAAVSVEGVGKIASFEFDPDFLQSDVELSPIVLPLRGGVHQFPNLAIETFHGLPGLLADSLPDRFGNAVFDAWIARQGRRRDEVDCVERLCYTGARAMGALEYEPVLGPAPGTAEIVHVDELVDLASRILKERAGLSTTLTEEADEQAMLQVLRVGASAGGARAKAVIAWSPDTNEVRSGQVQAPPGFEYWLLKFDGVAENRDRELADPQGYGAIEFAYAMMARDAGIDMMDCRLLEEHGRRHFMTKRFDRTDQGEKLHMQTLGALAHLDLNQPLANSYEQAFRVIRELQLPMDATEEMFRRMLFNIVARNQDDHVKNIAFLMNKYGVWSLAPAFDVTYSYNPSGVWTAKHQMSMNGRREGFTQKDVLECARRCALKRGRARNILDEVITSVRQWPKHAHEARVNPEEIERIAAAHRLEIPESD